MLPKEEGEGTEAEAKESRTISGYAAVFNQPSDTLGWFVEYIQPGAFTNALKTSDVRALINHDSNLVLARSSSGTLKLKEDDKGLHFEFEAPETTYGNDLLVNIRSGNIKECSFMFTTKTAQWTWATKEGETDTRTIVEVGEIYDISPVTFPAYPSTEVALRSKTNNQRPAEDNSEDRIIIEKLKLSYFQ